MNVNELLWLTCCFTSFLSIRQFCKSVLLTIPIEQYQFCSDNTNNLLWKLSYSSEIRLHNGTRCKMKYYNYLENSILPIRLDDIYCIWKASSALQIIASMYNNHLHRLICDLGNWFDRWISPHKKKGAKKKEWNGMQIDNVNK